MKPELDYLGRPLGRYVQLRLHKTTGTSAGTTVLWFDASVLDLRGRPISFRDARRRNHYSGWTFHGNPEAYKRTRPPGIATEVLA